MIYKILRMSELLQTLLSNPYFLILLFPVTTLTFFVVGLVLMDLKYLKNRTEISFLSLNRQLSLVACLNELYRGGIT